MGVSVQLKEQIISQHFYCLLHLPPTDNHIEYVDLRIVCAQIIVGTDWENVWASRVAILWYIPN